MEINNRQDHLAIDDRQIAKAAAAAAGSADPPISISIVDNETIRELNRIHRGEDESTDVLAFDYGGGLDPRGEADGAEDDVAGEVIVSAEKAVETAESLGCDPAGELVLYVVHGVLHLAGYDDANSEEAERMRRREREVMSGLGLPDPWAAGATPASGAAPASAAAGDLEVFTDGACRGNPGPGGWAIRVLYPDGRVLEKGGAERNTTNNRMELTAALQAVKEARQAPRAVIVTDSEYVRLGITRWMPAWKERGWKTVKREPVQNRDLWEALSAALGPGIRWRYVAGHAGDPDNERCDRIAVSFAEGRPVELADGSKIEPRVPPEKRAAAAARKKERRGTARGKALFYLSLVGGVVERHATWPECEARVKGVSAARYKKCTRPDEEAEVLKEWGVASAPPRRD